MAHRIILLSRYGREDIILQAQDWREGGFMEKKLGFSVVGEAAAYSTFHHCEETDYGSNGFHWEPVPENLPI